MSNVKNILLCVRMNLKKASVEPRIYVVMAVSLVFQYYTFNSLHTICDFLGEAVTPWVFPFFLGSPSLFFIYGGQAMLLFCDAPFLDSQAPFVMIRTGRRGWIIGQILYVFLLSLLYTFWNCLIAALLLLPDVSFEAGWGKVLWTISANPDIFQRVGVPGSFHPQGELMGLLSPMQATTLSILLYWLGTVLIGMVILCFRVLTGGMIGIAISGVLTVLAYFTCYLGTLNYGWTLLFLSPVNWSCMSFLDWFRSGTAPSPGYALTVYIIMIAALSVASVSAFCRKDVSFADGGR